MFKKNSNKKEPTESKSLQMNEEEYEKIEKVGELKIDENESTDTIKTLSGRKTDYIDGFIVDAGDEKFIDSFFKKRFYEQELNGTFITKESAAAILDIINELELIKGDSWEFNKLTGEVNNLLKKIAKIVGISDEIQKRALSFKEKSNVSFYLAMNPSISENSVAYIISLEEVSSIMLLCENKSIDLAKRVALSDHVHDLFVKKNPELYDDNGIFIESKTTSAEVVDFSKIIQEQNLESFEQWMDKNDIFKQGMVHEKTKILSHEEICGVGRNGAIKSFISSHEDVYHNVIDMISTDFNGNAKGIAASIYICESVEKRILELNEIESLVLLRYNPFIESETAEKAEALIKDYCKAGRDEDYYHKKLDLTKAQIEEMFAEYLLNKEKEESFNAFVKSVKKMYAHSMYEMKTSE